MPHNIIGWIHTIAAIIALITGSMILAKANGTFQHKITGRIYGVSMLIVCITAFIKRSVKPTYRDVGGM